jgi:gliding motility-associated-like protein
VDPSPTFSGGGVAGVFGSTAGLSINVASGLIDLSASTAGTYTVTNTIAAASGCPASAPTSSITITALPIGTFSYVASPYCSTGVDPLPTYSGGGVAGTFSGTSGLVINAATGLVDLGASTAGTFTVTNTISASGGCPLVAPISTITITTALTGLFSYISTPYCSDAVNPLPTFSGGGVAGVFSSTAGLVINGASGLVDLSACVPGTYTVTNTIAAFAGCPAITPTSSITVTSLPTGVFSYVDAPYCADGINPIPVLGAGSSAGIYSSTAGLTINPANGEVDLGLSAPATYVVTNSIAAAAGCPIVLTTSNIVINGIPAAPSVSADTTYCSFTSPGDIVAIAAGGGTITWYSDVTLLDSIGSGLTFTPITTVGTNNYYVTETVSGCESPASLSIQVIHFCDIEIPTAFTPDGDLVNDSWELKFIDEVFNQSQVKIYNRWGNLIFESSKGQYETKPFDGTFNGDQLPISSYYYIIEYNDGATENATGTVTIIRK